MEQTENFEEYYKRNLVNGVGFYVPLNSNVTMNLQAWENLGGRSFGSDERNLYENFHGSYKEYTRFRYKTLERTVNVEIPEQTDRLYTDADGSRQPAIVGEPWYTQNKK